MKDERLLDQETEHWIGQDKYGGKWAELPAQGWSIGGLTFSFEAVLLAVSDKIFQNDLNKICPT